MINVSHSLAIFSDGVDMNAKLLSDEGLRLACSDGSDNQGLLNGSELGSMALCGFEFSLWSAHAWCIRLSKEEDNAHARATSTYHGKGANACKD